MLAGKGYKKIYNMAGGIKAWDAEIAVGPQDLGVHLFSGQEQPEDVLKTAYSLEQGLREFYLSMADQAVDPGVKSMFTKLSEIEIKHQEAIIKAYKSLGSPDITTEEFVTMADAQAMEGGLTTDEYLNLFGPDLGSAVDVVSMAMSIEAQALDLYLRVGSDLKDETARAIVLKIADEEKEHLASLGRLMETL